MSDQARKGGAYVFKGYPYFNRSHHPLPLPTQAHDIYSHLVDEVGASCCDNRDCQPLLYRFTANGVQIFVDKRWIDVPSDRTQYRSLSGNTSETDSGHWCGSTYELGFSNLGALYITKCTILSPQYASLRVEWIGVSGR